MKHRLPRTEHDPVLAGVKATPFGWPAASLLARRAGPTATALRLIDWRSPSSVKLARVPSFMLQQVDPHEDQGLLPRPLASPRRLLLGRTLASHQRVPRLHSSTRTARPAGSPPCRPTRDLE